MYMSCMSKHLWRAEEATAPPELGVTKSHGPLGPGSLERAGSSLTAEPSPGFCVPLFEVGLPVA